MTVPRFNPETIFDRLQNRAESAELIQSESAFFPVVFKAGRLQSAQSKFACVAGLRVISGGRIGFAAGQNPDNLDSLIDRALQSAQFGEKACFSFPGQPDSLKIPVTDSEDVRRLSLDQKIASGEQAVAALRQGSSTDSVDLQIASSEGTLCLHNTAGLSLRKKQTAYDFQYALLRIDQNGLLWLGDGNTSGRVDDRSEKQIERTRRLLDLAHTVVKPGTPDTVIFEPSVVSNLVASFLAGINGKTVYKGSSPLSGKLEKPIADPRFSLFETPWVDDNPAASGFDGEGIPKSEKPLIQKGLLQSFVYDLQTAGLTRNHPTGNAHRSPQRQPSPGYSILSIPAGSETTDQLIQSTQNGLWVHSVLGGGQSNMLAGDFSLNAHLAYRIENGKIAGRVKDTMISGNVYTIFNQLVAIGSETDDSGAHYFPPMAFNGVRVTG